MRVFIVILPLACACAVASAGDDVISPPLDASSHDALADHAIDHGGSAYDAPHDAFEVEASQPEASTADAAIDAPESDGGTTFDCSNVGCPTKQSCCMNKASSNFGKCVYSSCLVCCQ